MRTIHLNQLTPPQQELLAKAATARLRAYTHHYATGAALRTTSGKLFLGANYENNAYDSLCAEQVAIASANTAGETDIAALAVIGGVADKKTAEVAAPCGQCRQYLAEAAHRQGHDIEVVMANNDQSKIVIASSSELLPMAFRYD